MSQKTRAALKAYFETGSKPTQEQFADLIDSVFNLTNDAGAKVKQLLEALNDTERLRKNAVRGADFALNRRGKGNILDPSFYSSMIDVLKGDFWIFHEEEPSNSEFISEGDWVIALVDGATPPNYEGVNWQIVHFGDTTVQQNTIELQHYRTSPTGETQSITISGIHAQVVSMSINHLTYYGKLDDGNFGNYDFVYAFAGANTVISINYGMLGFMFLQGMVVDIIYILIPQ